jgi:transposase InsO family protein
MMAMDALLEAGAQIDNVQRWCHEHGINPRTFYRHRARIQAEGTWRERSRRPHQSPAATSAEVDAWICKLRADLAPDNGADYIRDELARIAAATQPTWSLPSRSTINRVLARHDLLERNPAKRPRSSWRRFAYARPRDCYQIDATELTLPNGHSVAIFDVLDDCTRMLVACHAAPTENAATAATAITKAFTTHGPPAIVLADNGAAFTAHRFTHTVHQAGTHLIHSSPYHPQTCGKVERHHQTLKKWLRTQPPPTTLRQLQRQLDTYRAYYNTRRPHSALPGRSTPHHAWNTTATHGSPHHLPRQTDATIHHTRVSATGTISIGKGQRIGVGCAHRGQTLAIIRDGHHATVYTSDGHVLGTATFTGTSYTPLTPTP